MSNLDPQMTGRRFPLEYGADVSSGAIVKFFNAVYAWMAVGLAVTAVVAWFTYVHHDALRALFSGGAILFIVIAQLALVVTISAAIQKISAPVATALFVLYAALNGVLFSSIFAVYAHTSIATTFLTCAAMFAVMSLYGMFTKSNLATMGKIMFMALIGLIIASIVNFFTASSALYWIISYAGVIIFCGLTAYDTQRLKQIAVVVQEDAAMSARLSVNGALSLYLNFINLFLFLLRFMGRRN
jgi:FtsH-binding integral membrane protein